MKLSSSKQPKERSLNAFSQRLVTALLFLIPSQCRPWTMTRLCHRVSKQTLEGGGNVCVCTHISFIHAHTAPAWCAPAWCAPLVCPSGVPLWCAPLVFRLAPALVQAAVDAHAVGGARDRPRVSILQPALLVVHVREQTGSLFGNCCEGLVLILLHCTRKFIQRWQQLSVWPATLDLR